MSAQISLTHGNHFPYDADDAWWLGAGDNPPPPTDWAHAAARGVIANLQNRAGIKHSFADIEQGIRVEIVQSLAAIIRLARDTDPQLNLCESVVSAQEVSP